ncbi:flagellar filament capping protein FliD [Marinobacter sp. HL-58]|uniref:flagellar filament capping protein FliD n=1 Tax=Marinobacter sp. HL-58 TaxID=1479237 RepID=UPI0004844C6A|nr:flagellar filament capping protein FliD [Marinobacter sp. HL-58]KPQ02388.1 MAG: flagellar hook-associated protein FliD [Marinobacter sp. HL-58]
MASISSLGIGSGVLNQDLVDKLVSAERDPKVQQFDLKTEQAEAKLSAYGQLKSAVTELRLPMRQLGSADAMRSFSADVSGSSVDVSVDSSQASRGTYNIEVDRKASAQALASGTFDDRDSTSVGRGTLSFAVGDKTTNIEIDENNDTLQGLANAINDSDAGVSASIINTGDGYRLVMSANETGEANRINITATDSDGNNTDAGGLSQFVMNDDVQNLDETTPAQDALLSINGIEVTSASNTVEDVVDGLTFNIKDTGSSSVAVDQDTGKVAERVQEFVDKFNAVQSTIGELTDFDAEEGQASILTGDSTVRSIQNQLKRVLTDMVPGLEDANVRSLADVGITTDWQSGELQFDSQKFQQQLLENPDDVTALFAEQGRASDSQVEFVRSGNNTEAGEYAINVTEMATRGALQTASPLADGATIDDSNDQLSFLIDGETRADITLTAGTYDTREDLAAEIEKQLKDNPALNSADRSVSVGVDPDTGALTFTSGRYASESSVDLIAVDDQTTNDLGLSTQDGTAGTDVAGTINGQQARGDGQVLYLGEDSGPASGLQVRIAGGETGARGSVDFIKGVSDRTVDAITGILGASGQFDARTNSLNRELDRIDEQRERLDLRIESYQERLVKQFSAADSLVGQFNQTGDYLTQQLAGMSGNSQQGQ